MRLPSSIADLALIAVAIAIAGFWFLWLEEDKSSKRTNQRESSVSRSAQEQSAEPKTFSLSTYALTNTRSGLTLNRMPRGGMDISQATQYCRDFSLNGHTDWRLPSSAEFSEFFAASSELGESWVNIFGGTPTCASHRSTTNIFTSDVENNRPITMTCNTRRFASQPMSYQAGVLCIRNTDPLKNMRPDDRSATITNTQTQNITEIKIVSVSEGPNNCAKNHGAIAYGSTAQTMYTTRNHCSEDSAVEAIRSACATCAVMGFWGQPSCGALAIARDGAWGMEWGSSKVEAGRKAEQHCAKWTNRSDCSVRGAVCNGTPRPGAIENSARNLEEESIPFVTPAPAAENESPLAAEIPSTFGTPAPTPEPSSPFSAQRSIIASGEKDPEPPGENAQGILCILPSGQQTLLEIADCRANGGIIYK